MRFALLHVQKLQRQRTNDGKTKEYIQKKRKRKQVIVRVPCIFFQLNRICLCDKVWMCTKRLNPSIEITLLLSNLQNIVVDCNSIENIMNENYFNENSNHSNRWLWKCLLCDFDCFALWIHTFDLEILAKSDFHFFRIFSFVFFVFLLDSWWWRMDEQYHVEAVFVWKFGYALTIFNSEQCQHISR